MGKIGGEKREEKSFEKYVGLFEAEVIAVNPDAEEYEKLTGRELEEGDKSVEYLGESSDGNTYLRLEVWLKQLRTDRLFRVSFYLEDKERENRDMTKYQFINNAGKCSWADDPNNLLDWFTKGREYRRAFVGEEQLYNFMRTWLGKLDLSKTSSVLELDWKKLMKGNTKEIKDEIGGEWCTPIVALATIRTTEQAGEIKEYQSVYNKEFLPAYMLKFFRLRDYSDAIVIEQLNRKRDEELKPHEKFVLRTIGEHGCKDYFEMRPLVEYDPEKNITATNSVMEEHDTDGPSY